MALPSVVPATVVSAARIPWLAPVAITKVTIGPGVMTRTVGDQQKGSEQFPVHDGIRPAGAYRTPASVGHDSR